jgi:hypothetical protein
MLRIKWIARDQKSASHAPSPAMLADSDAAARMIEGGQLDERENWRWLELLLKANGRCPRRRPKTCGVGVAWDEL